MKRIYIWLKTKWLKFKLRKARSFMEANCLARIKAGSVRNACDDAIEDWVSINDAITDIFNLSLYGREVSSERQSEDKQAE